MEGPRPSANPTHHPSVLARGVVGSSAPFAWGVGLGRTAGSSARCQASQPALASHSGICCQASLGPQRLDLSTPTAATATVRAVLVRLFQHSLLLSDQALQAMEARWLASVHANPTGTARLRSDQPDSQPAWMTPSHASRLHWSHRQQQRDEQQQQQQRQSHQQQPQLPSERAAASDTIDVLVALGSHAQQSQWRRVWELSNATYFDRQHRTLWWRILHGSLMCGA